MAHTTTSNRNLTMEVTSQPAASKATATKSTMLQFTGGDQRTGMFIFKKVVVSPTDDWDSG